jgi:perosamine synthetase
MHAKTAGMSELNTKSPVFSAMRVPIARPEFGPEESAAVLEVLASRQLSKGPRGEVLERGFADYHGARHAVAVNSGTAAIVASLHGHGIGPGDEVIVPSFSFFATASAVLAAGATPVFADIDPLTACLSPDATRAAITPRTRAIMPVHLYGLPADMPGFAEIARLHDLVLLEDAAQAHGAAILDRRVGSFGTAAFSFFSSKNMTTGEGGMLLTDNPEVARRARMFRNHGRDGELHEALGGNYRMGELEAALGCVQLGRLPAFTNSRRETARYYDQHLPEGLIRQHVPSGFHHVYHQYTVRVPARLRDGLVARLNERGVAARVYYRRPIHREPVLEGRPEYRGLDLPETERASREVLSLPVYPGLTETERAYVVEAVTALL